MSFNPANEKEERLGMRKAKHARDTCINAKQFYSKIGTDRSSNQPRRNIIKTRVSLSYESYI